MPRPRIGVSVSTRSGWRIYPLIAFNIWLAGGRADRWDARRGAAIDEVDGIVIGGGDDISPDLYGGELVSTARIDGARDALERLLAEQAAELGLPVLGICRGSQMLNVAFGGTLWQDAYGTFERSRKHYTVLPRKQVCPEEGSLLAEITGPEELRVNALHSQAVHELGRGFRVAARDEGGMIQAIERTRPPFCLGVQWHPEHLFYARRQRAIFRALVAAAAKKGTAPTAEDMAFA